MNTRKEKKKALENDCTPGEDARQSLPVDNPPAWFLTEMERGFSKIHDMVEDRLEKINKVVEEIHTEHSAINKKLLDLSATQTEYEAVDVDLRADISDYKKESDAAMEELRGELDDMENRARRNNLCLVGFPEGVEGSDGVKFLEEWLPKILKVDAFFEIERCHRTLQPRSAEQGNPRALVIRLLRSSDTEKILAAARQQTKLEYGNSTIMIFRDVSTARYQRRKAFIDLKKLLRTNDTTYSLLYPATLRIELPGGRRSFTSPKSAETYLRQHHPEYFESKPRVSNPQK